jgi:Na+-translocating ferredoxin:NAD+ oxidoreductase RNF subunit RnfB
MTSTKDIRGIYQLLPKLNCGLCGFGNCGQFAKAVAEGRGSPFGCVQDPWVGYRISGIVGVRPGPAGYGFQKRPYTHGTSPPSMRSMKEEVNQLITRMNHLLERIEAL